jgi:hypothetical protein
MMTTQIVAAAGLLFSGAYAQESLSRGSGFGTYYYDIEQINACGTSFAAQNEGGVMCSHITSLSLTNMNTNYVVAMNNTLLRGDMVKYCGKKVVVFVNSVASDLPLFIGDGCERCATGPSTSGSWEANGAPGLDFSYSVLNELSESACAKGHIDIAWNIVDEMLYNFDTDGSGSSQGPVSGSRNGGSRSSAAATSASFSAFKESTTSVTQESASTSSAADVSQAQTAKAPSTTTDAPAILSGLEAVATPAITDLSAPCATGVWQCSGDALVQCLDGKWVTRATCTDGLSCQGGHSPYCAPAGYGN